jgi:hypothetical protein
MKKGKTKIQQELRTMLIFTALALPVVSLFLIYPLTRVVLNGKPWVGQSSKLAAARELLGEQLPETTILHYAEGGKGLDVPPEYTGWVLAAPLTSVRVNLAEISPLKGLWRSEGGIVLFENEAFNASLSANDTRDWGASISGSSQKTFVEAMVHFDSIPQDLFYQPLPGQVAMIVVYPTSTSTATFKERNLELVTDITFYLIPQEDYAELEDIFNPGGPSSLALWFYLILLVVIVLITVGWAILTLQEWWKTRRK